MRAEARFRPCSSPKAMSKGECRARLRLNSGAAFDPKQKMLSVVSAQHQAHRAAASLDRSGLGNGTSRMVAQPISLRRQLVLERDPLEFFAEVFDSISPSPGYGCTVTVPAIPIPGTYSAVDPHPTPLGIAPRGRAHPARAAPGTPPSRRPRIDFKPDVGTTRGSNITGVADTPVVPTPCWRGSQAACESSE